MGMGQNPGTPSEPQVIAGLKWMDVHPTKNGIIIGIDPYPNQIGPEPASRET